MSAIIIFSNEFDLTTNDVVDWVKSMDENEYDIIRIGSTNIITIPYFTFRIHNNDITIYINEKDIHSCWFRKAFQISIFEKNIFESTIENFLFEEIDEFRKSLYYAMPWGKIKTLGKNNLNFYDVNKMRTLLMAQSVGLVIPPTVITFSKEEIIAFKKQHGKIISKPLVGPQFLMTGDTQHKYAMYTSIVNQESVEILDDTITPCFVQKYIEKAIELRIFFCEDEYYCAAIFSQNNHKTLTDFRNYGSDSGETNKFVPFRLIEEEEAKLIKLVNLIGLNTGSIDMILTPEGEYIFLEVNPVGQFGMISHPCNYHLEEKVATFLTT